MRSILSKTGATLKVTSPESWFLDDSTAESGRKNLDFIVLALALSGP